ncbi:YqgQ family protein [Bacillus seohaeanensis]|uniref:YqgQ family protein n=1 Tax=Bacillus seohaeanensis TaxID=284580 RepID=A0ABW5RP91_9BACI
MNSIYDIQQLLKKYGTVIYIGKRLYDLQLMEDELKELYQSQLVDPKEFQTALLIIRHEIQIEKEKQID